MTEPTRSPFKGKPLPKSPPTSEPGAMVAEPLGTARMRAHKAHHLRVNPKSFAIERLKADSRSALLQHGSMWDEFVAESQLTEFPENTRKVFLRFVNRANRSMSHPLDWRRFYEFVRYAHARRARISRERL